jgi:hypothetical protein
MEQDPKHDAALITIPTAAVPILSNILEKFEIIVGILINSNVTSKTKKNTKPFSRMQTNFFSRNHKKNDTAAQPRYGGFV